MKYLHFILIVILQLFLNKTYAQTYISPNQSYSFETNNYSDHIFIRGEKKIFRDSSSIEFEMINYPNYKGTLKYKDEVFNRDYEGVQYDFIDGNGFVIFTDDIIILRIRKNPDNYWCYFYLNNWKGGYTKQSISAHFDKKRAETIKNLSNEIYDYYLKKYGAFTAKCIVEKKIMVGMQEEGIDIIMGEPLKINSLETAKSIQKIYVYPYSSIFLENGKVIAIQRSE